MKNVFVGIKYDVGVWIRVLGAKVNVFVVRVVVLDLITNS
jgi:hypothetical protein